MKKYLFILFLLFFALFCEGQVLPVYSGWTVWSGGISDISIQTRSGSDLWLEVTSSHCTHGTHQYFNTTPTANYTIDFDLDLGTTGQVNLLIWDVTPGGTLYNLRVISYTASANGISEAFLAGDTRSLIQFRQDDCSGTYSFYLDKINIWAASTTNVVAAAPLDTDYRYGFNGQEKDDEIQGNGNTYTAEYWEYDPRIGRRWNVDPVVKYHESPYSTFSNNPIMLIDKTGADTSIADENARADVLAQVQADPEFAKRFTAMIEDKKNTYFFEKWAGTKDGNYGSVSYDGSKIVIGYSEMKNGGSAVLSALYEETEHGYQIVTGRAGFILKNNKWVTLGYDENDEADSFLFSLRAPGGWTTKYYLEYVWPMVKNGDAREVVTKRVDVHYTSEVVKGDYNPSEMPSDETNGGVFNTYSGDVTEYPSYRMHTNLDWLFGPQNMSQRSYFK